MLLQTAWSLHGITTLYFYGKLLQLPTYKPLLLCRDMHASYTPAFKACIQEGKAESVMCSYNAVNGKPACASPELLQGTLRGTLGFEGVIVSDCGAVDGVFNLHEYTKCVCNPVTR